MLNQRHCLLLILALSFASGCGYTFQGSGSVLPADVKKIYIPMVDNNSTETALTQLVTESIRDQFDKYGVVTVVEEINGADAVLKTRILKVSRKPRTVTSNTDTVQQFDTVLTISGELRRSTGPVLWRNPSFTVSRAIGASSDVVTGTSADFASGSIGASDLGSLDSREISRGQEAEALERLATEVARRIYDEAVAPDF